MSQHDERGLGGKFQAQELDLDALDEVSGGFLPIIYGAAAAIEVMAPGAIAAIGAAGWAAASNPAAVVRGLTNGVQTLENAYDAASNYLNPSPGHGAPGDTYVPATANADGSINPGHFEAPGTSNDQAAQDQAQDQAQDAEDDHSGDQGSGDQSHDGTGSGDTSGGDTSGGGDTSEGDTSDGGDTGGGDTGGGDSSVGNDFGDAAGGGDSGGGDSGGSDVA